MGLKPDATVPLEKAFFVISISSVAEDKATKMSGLCYSQTDTFIIFTVQNHYFLWIHLICFHPQSSCWSASSNSLQNVSVPFPGCSYIKCSRRMWDVSGARCSAAEVHPVLERGLHWDPAVLKWAWSARQPSPCWVPRFSSMVSLRRRKWNWRGSWLYQFL